MEPLPATEGAVRKPAKGSGGALVEWVNRACHLANHAMLLGRKLRWNPEKEDFLGDDVASALVARPRRAPYDIEI